MPCKYLVLSLLCINAMLPFAFETFAFPLSKYAHRQALEPTLSPNTTHGVQTIETTQSFNSANGITIQRCTIVSTPTTLSDGESVVIITQNCSSTLVPSSQLSTTATESFSSTLINASLTVSSTFTFSTSAVPTSMGVTASASSVTNSSPANPTSSSFLNTSIDTSNSATNKTTGGGHVSSLPIFIGAFGGVASLALTIVGCTVYRPFKRFNIVRSNLPCIKRMRSKPSPSSSS